MTGIKDDTASHPDDDNPEWTVDEMVRARPASEVLPQFIGEKATQELLCRGRGRPAKPASERKVNQTLRLDADVLASYRQLGAGWQRRINDVLREHMPRHK